MNKRYLYLEDDEYWAIADTHLLKTLDAFKKELIDDGYLEDGYTMDDIQEIAEEHYHEYIMDDHYMAGEMICDVLNGHEEAFQEYEDTVYELLFQYRDLFSEQMMEDINNLLGFEFGS